MTTEITVHGSRVVLDVVGDDDLEARLAEMMADPPRWTTARRRDHGRRPNARERRRARRQSLNFYQRVWKAPKGEMGIVRCVRAHERVMERRWRKSLPPSPRRNLPDPDDFAF